MLFLVALGLRFGAWAFSSCSELGRLFFVLHGCPIAVAPLVVEHAFSAGFGGCGPRAQLLRGMWNLAEPGIEPVLPEPQVDSEVLYRQESP